MQSGKSAFSPAGNAEIGLREHQRRFLESATISPGLPSFSYASLRDPRVFETVVGRSLEVNALCSNRRSDECCGTFQRAAGVMLH